MLYGSKLFKMERPGRTMVQIGAPGMEMKEIIQSDASQAPNVTQFSVYSKLLDYIHSVHTRM